MKEENIEQISKVIFENAWAFWVMAITTFPNEEVFNDLHNPKVGEFVFENTNPFVAFRTRIGKLLERKEDGSCVIEMIDGKTMLWPKGKIIKIANETTNELIKKLAS